MRSIALGVFCLIPLFAQAPAPQPGPAKPAAESKPAPPPDRKAFMDARGQKDPSARIAALDKFLGDFPASGLTPIARREIVGEALKRDPKEAVRRTKGLTRRLGPVYAAWLNRFLAAELVKHKTLLPEAEKAARRAVKQLKYLPFAAHVRREAKQEKQPDPADAQIRALFDTEQAQVNETLGQVFLERGRTADARRMFEEALRDNPSLSPAALGLANLAEKEGKAGQALDYHAQAMLARPSPESRKRFSDAWTKVKGGDAGQTEWLDQKHRALFASPLHPVKYAPTAERTARVVLGELYTGAGCPPCLSADLAFDSMLERYSRADFVFVAFHQHIPRPDPMANADTIARWKWMNGRGVPAYAIGGKPVDYGGGSRDAALPTEVILRGRIDAELETAPLARLDLSTTQDAGAVSVMVKVDGIAQESPDLVLTIVLVEKELTYSGENGFRFHPMVARSIANFPLSGAKSKSESHRFDLAAVQAALVKHIAEFEKHDERHNKDGNFRFAEYKSTIGRDHLAVVAFVQDLKTRQVLQAVYGDPGGARRLTE